MDKEIKISIVTVVFNCQKYIEKCIKSVLNQDYPNIEYIVIDGRSTDKTLDIIKRYKSSIDIFKSEKDKNHFDAMNKALAMATGDYIFFLNADDFFYANNVVSNVANKIHNIKPDFIYGNIARINTKDGSIMRFGFCVAKEKIKNGLAIKHQSLFVKTKLLRFVGGFDMKYHIASDFDIFCKLYINNCNGFYMDKIISGSYMGGKTDNNFFISRQEKALIVKKHYGFYYYVKYQIKIFIEFIFIKILKAVGLYNIFRRIKWRKNII